VAVLGSGPDRPYPPEHAELLQAILGSGGAVTEHLPGTPPRAHHFPRRNRLLVALCEGLVVAEARLKSGTTTSVRWALDLGKEVMAVPGPVDQALGQGTLALLRDGAIPVGSAAEILEVLGYARPALIRADEAERLSAPEFRLLDLLQGGALDLDELARLSGEPPGRLLALLLNLEVRGRVVRDPGMAYRLP
jgi:DNA processing protein